MNSVIRLETEIIKAQTNKESVIVVFFVGQTISGADHIRIIEKKCKRNVRCLTGREWGASSSLERIYVALIRSVLDYRSVAYGSS